MKTTKQIIADSLLTFNGSAARLAAELGVSEASVLRWAKGTSCPRPAMEAALRQVSTEGRSRAAIGGEQLYLYHMAGDNERIRTSLDRTLSEVRELLHRKGQISSRNEALEEVGVILFAHICDIKAGGTGLAYINCETNGLGDLLNRFVERCLKQRNLDKSFINGSLRYLRLGSDADDVAGEIVRAFRPLFSIRDALRGCDFDLLNEVFGKFIADSFIDEKELGQYLTPPEVVSFMSRLAARCLSRDGLNSLLCADDSCPACLILDPSCGVGSFLVATAREASARAFEEGLVDNASQAAEAILKRHCVGVDKSERMLRLGLLNFAMFGQERPRMYLANALSRTGTDGSQMKKLEGKAQLIVTNPPFGANFGRSDIQKYRIAGAWCAKARVRIDSELLFLERYIDWLAPGGHVFAIVPDSILTNKNSYQDLRSGLAKEVLLHDVISLPPVTFAAAGTTTKTSIVHLEKPRSGRTIGNRTRFAVCTSLGYEVVTRGSHRIKKARGTNQLDAIVRELLSENKQKAFVSEVADASAESRWDAQFFCSPSANVERRLASNGSVLLRVKDVASLINERMNPIRLNTDHFRYVEISDIDQKTMIAYPKDIPIEEAPSRARKVAQKGDVLVSTVRPERGTVGILVDTEVPIICTTGLAILRPKEIHPMILAALLKAEFVLEQMTRNNVGIAYPAIEEEILEGIILPLDRQMFKHIEKHSRELFQAEQRVSILRESFMREIGTSIEAWAVRKNS